jgi:hypothetical protein
MKSLKRIINLVLLLVLIGVLVGCGANSEPQAPPPETTPLAEVEITQETLDVISLRIDQIQLVGNASDRVLLIDNIWMIPLNTETLEGMNARFQYVTDGEPIELNARNPYRPATPFMLSVDKSRLAGKDFGIWFMITSFGSNGESLRRQFEELLHEVIPFAGMTVLTAALTAVTPGVPEEVVAASSVVTQGVGIMGRVAALGGGVLRAVQRGMQFETEQMASETITQLAESLSAAASVASKSAYFGEAYVTFSALDNYRLNNRVSIVTTDGSLLIEFSVIETTNEPLAQALPTTELVSTTLRIDECNPHQPSQITSGVTAQVVPLRQNVFRSPIDSTSPVVFTLRQGQQVTPAVSYCDVESATLWWRICNADNICGWVAESQGSTRYLELVR